MNRSTVWSIFIRHDKNEKKYYAANFRVLFHQSSRLMLQTCNTKTAVDSKLVIPNDTYRRVLRTHFSRYKLQFNKSHNTILHYGLSNSNSSVSTFSFHISLVLQYAISLTKTRLIGRKSRNFYILPVFSDPQEMTPSEFHEDVWCW